MHGLERVAGIRLDNRPGLDNRQRVDTPTNKLENRVSNHGPSDGATLRIVSSVPRTEIPIQATMRLPEGLWIRAKIKAMEQRENVSDYVRRLIEADLAEQPKRKARGGEEPAK